MTSTGIKMSAAKRGIILAATTGWLALGATALAAEQQQTFPTPEAASEALIAAAQANKTAELEKILGPSGRKLIYSGDRVADKERREKFVADYAERHTIEKASETKAVLVLSAEDWPFPIPIVKQGEAWWFDTAAGADEIINRRIGANELNAIQVVDAIVDAEHEYASKARTGSGYLEYAAKFRSSPGKRDGLYWPEANGEPSPIGPLVVSATAEGYGAHKPHQKPSPYHGYYYRLLTEQGEDAPGGAYSYFVRGHMIGGFALVAYPATYGDSGVMSFMVDRDGVIYEKNLGPDTGRVAASMTTFNPDQSWTIHP